MNYGLIGETGRLGTEVKNIFDENNHNLVLSYSLDGEVIKSKPDVIIDCSLPEVVARTINFIEQFSIPLVIATTNLSEKQIEELKNISKIVAVIQSYNFSIGIQILLKLASFANKFLGEWDIEISETHHRFKKDKPSGTAKMIQNIINQKEVNTSSMRLGNVPGEHTIYFGGLGEVLSISHQALSRRTFAEGILKSVEFALNAKPGFYSFTDVLFKNN
jgi:4-hydroxy-tetrahydrodipicolinate reductase